MIKLKVFIFLILFITITNCQVVSQGKIVTKFAKHMAKRQTLPWCIEGMICEPPYCNSVEVEENGRRCLICYCA